MNIIDRVAEKIHAEKQSGRYVVEPTAGSSPIGAVKRGET